VLIVVIVAAKKCVEGVSMSWAPYLLNQFLINYSEAQDRGMEFHYPWLVIMIVFTAWEEPEDAQFLGLRSTPCLAAKYQNLWYTSNKRRQIDTNVEFFLYGERIQHCIRNTTRISQQVVDTYTLVTWFMEK
jgi:hypothetical protein